MDKTNNVKKRKNISPEDLDLFSVVDTSDEAT